MKSLTLTLVIAFFSVASFAQDFVNGHQVEYVSIKGKEFSKEALTLTIDIRNNKIYSNFWVTGNAFRSSVQRSNEGELFILGNITTNIVDDTIKNGFTEHKEVSVISFNFDSSNSSDLTMRYSKENNTWYYGMHVVEGVQLKIVK